MHNRRSQLGSDDGPQLLPLTGAQELQVGSTSVLRGARRRAHDNSFRVEEETRLATDPRFLARIGDGDSRKKRLLLPMLL